MRRMMLSLLLLSATVALPAEAKVTRYLTGNAADVAVSLAGPAHDFGGGSTDVDAAIQWMIDQVRGCTSCSSLPVRRRRCRRCMLRPRCVRARAAVSQRC